MALTSKNQALENRAAGLFEDQPMFKTWTATAARANHSGFTMLGQPAAASYTGTTLVRQQVKGGNSQTHDIIGFRPAGGSRKRYLERLEVTTLTTNATGYLAWYDLVAYYPLIDGTIITLQTLDNTTALPRFTDGVGLRMMLEVTTVFGVSAGTIATIIYTNQAGTGSRSTTVTLTQSAAVGRLPHTFLEIPLQGNDYGVQSVQSVQLDVALNGSSAFALLLVMPICTVGIGTVGLPSARDLLNEGAPIELHQDAALLPIFQCGAVITPNIQANAQTVEA